MSREEVLKEAVRGGPERSPDACRRSAKEVGGGGPKRSPSKSQKKALQEVVKGGRKDAVSQRRS